MILFVAIGGLLAMMGGFVWYASLDIPDLEKVEVKLQSVELVEVNSVENRAKMQVTFLVKNPGEKTFTVPNITYELFTNGKSIGRGTYSTEDISMPGRAAFYPGAEVPLKHFFEIVLSDENANEYDSIVSGNSLKYSAQGVITTETSWSIVEKEFQTSM